MTVGFSSVPPQRRTGSGFAPVRSRLHLFSPWRRLEAAAAADHSRTPRPRTTPPPALRRRARCRVGQTLHSARLQPGVTGGLPSSGARTPPLRLPGPIRASRRRSAWRWPTGGPSEGAAWEGASGVLARRCRHLSNIRLPSRGISGGKAHGGSHQPTQRPGDHAF